MKIKSLKKKSYKGKVYNLGVGNDNTPWDQRTYVANGLVIHNCYMDSTAKGKHTPASDILKWLEEFTYKPYQVALGGGEPNTHPEFISLLRQIREDLGIVPNYTTSGIGSTKPLLKATDKYCGGVSVSYHPHMNENTFLSIYSKYREALSRAHLNVHVIADKNVIENIQSVMKVDDPNLSIILLAYYPIGRGTEESIMGYNLYNRELPAFLKSIKDKVKINFSEGLLPYFLSRPDILGSSINGWISMEGRFSAYLDQNHGLHSSSFSTRYANREKSLQKQWEDFYSFYCGDICAYCPMNDRCSSDGTDASHFLMCKRQSFNE
jgi:MoaA/NifB/PqqE/SkfB family radical SAM enzyme